MVKCRIDSRKHFFDLTLAEIEAIQKDLTLVNPQYVNAMKYSGRRVLYIPQYSFFYTYQSGNALSTPRGYEPHFLYTVVEEKYNEVACAFPPFVLPLRPAQEEAAKAYLSNPTKHIITMPTGKGKTITALHIAAKLGVPTLVIVHKNDLFVSWTKEVSQCFDNKLKCGIIKEKKCDLQQVTIATIQTLNSLKQRNREQYNQICSFFGLVIIDECHHTPAVSYYVLNDIPARYTMGLSATPERNDGLDSVLHFFLGGICYAYQIGEDDADVSKVKVISKRLYDVEYIPQVKYLGNLVPIDTIPYERRPKIHFSQIENVLMGDEHYLKEIRTDVEMLFHAGRNILIFCNQRQHCEALYEDLARNLPNLVPYMHIYYGGLSEKDADVLAKIETGEKRITIATYMKSNEGTNVIAWDTAMLVGSINNGLGVEQAVGRIRRHVQGKQNPVLVYDYSFDRVYSLKSHFQTRSKRYAALEFEVVSAIQRRPYGRMFGERTLNQ